MKSRTKWYIALLVLVAVAIGIFVFASKFQFSKTYEEEWNDYIESEEVITEINSEEDYVKLAESLYRGYEKRLAFDSEYFETEHAEKLYNGVYVTLNTDLDYGKIQELCEYKEVLPLREFSGIFDGRGHQISNIHISDNQVATLFYDLYGTVANLAIAEDSTYEAPIVASISNFTYVTARVVNCQATILQEDVPMVDYNIQLYDSVINCVSKDNTGSILADELNNTIGTLDLTNSPKSYVAWADTIDGPKFDKRDVVSIKEAVIDTKEWGAIKAFYSEDRECWMYVLPKKLDSLSDNQLKAVVHFDNGIDKEVYIPTDGSVITVTAPVSNDELSLEYSFAISHTNTIPVMAIDTYTDDGLSYIGYSKKSALSGEYKLQIPGLDAEQGIIDEFRGHGNHSWKFGNKRSFNLTLGTKTKLCGLDESYNYALISGERYNSLFSYMVNSEIARRIQMPAAPNTEFVHLYVDGNYLGVYFLTPKIEVADSRINIRDIKAQTQKINSKRLNEYTLEQYYTEGDKEKRMGYLLEKNPKDVSGGFIFELNSRDFEQKDARFRTKDGRIFVVRSMPYASLEMVNSLADTWSEFEEACDSSDGFNSKGRHYTEYIDPRSFALQWLMLDFNSEYSIGSSIYFYKDSDLSDDSRFYAVYPWDVEHSYLESSDSTILMDEDYLADERDYWRWYLGHPEFIKLAGALWQEVMLPELKDLFQSVNPEDSPMYKKYEADLLINQCRWANAKPLEKYSVIHNYAKERIKIMSERLK